MKKNFILFALLIGGAASAQQNFWRNQSKAAVSQDKLVERVHNPSQSIKLNLNYDQLVQHLTQVQGRNSETILKFPDDKGNFSNFKVIEQSNFHPDLQAKYPNIRSYVGYNIENPAEKINFSISPQFGLYGSIQGNGVNYLIDTYTKDKSSYMIYNKANVSREADSFRCEVEDNTVSALGIDNMDFDHIHDEVLSQKTVNNAQLKTLRLAITTVTEYSNYIIQQAGVTNGTEAEKKAAILAAVNLSVTRINGVLRSDIGVHLELVPNTDQLFFITTDTFNVSSASQMIEENVVVTNQIIGLANYDIGHLFFKVNSAGQSNGLALTPSICTSSKAAGVTGTVVPVGDPFDIDFTAHEIGHQFGGHHTQNNEYQRSGSPVEVGSGSTIMSYAGINPPNVQHNADAYYHQSSIRQMTNVLNSSNTYNCAALSDTNNLPPVIASMPSVYNIPHSTAFSLEMTATDPNNDQLTYAWDQMDTSIGEKMPPVSGNTRGPMFRSWTPSSNPVRFFPKMEKILADKIVFTTNPYRSAVSTYHLNDWEVVPNNVRNLNFTGTVRDNNPEVGQTATKNLIVRFRDAGPFKVTSQAVTETWTAGETASITWDVAGTDDNNINTANVKILLSLDGGITWEYTLVESTPNNGNYTFTVPTGIGETSNARLMIRPVDNIYLAVNKVNFTINSPLSVGDLEKVEAVTISPNPTKGEVNIQLNKNFKNVIVYVNDMTGKQVSNYNSSQQNAKTHKLNLSHLTNGVYVVTVKADGEQFSKKLIIKK